MQGEITLMRVALIRAVIGYCGIFLNTLYQIANWSSEAAELIPKGESMIGVLRRRLDGESGEEKGGEGEGYNESLMPNASPYELVIKIMVEEQIDKDSGPMDLISTPSMTPRCQTPKSTFGIEPRAQFPPPKDLKGAERESIWIARKSLDPVRYMISVQLPNFKRAQAEIGKDESVIMAEKRQIANSFKREMPRSPSIENLELGEVYHTSGLLPQHGRRMRRPITWLKKTASTC